MKSTITLRIVSQVLWSCLFYMCLLGSVYAVGEIENAEVDMAKAQQHIDADEKQQLGVMLYNSSVHGNLQVVQFLFDHGPLDAFNLKFKGERWLDLAFVAAANNNNEALIRLFLEHDVDINHITRAYRNAFMNAVAGIHLSIVQLMVSLNPDLTLADGFGSSGQGFSIYRLAYENINYSHPTQDAIDIFRLLVAAGAKPKELEIQYLNQSVIELYAEGTP